MDRRPTSQPHFWDFSPPRASSRSVMGFFGRVGPAPLRLVNVAIATVIHVTWKASPASKTSCPGMGPIAALIQSCCNEATQRVDERFPNVGGHLDRKNPAVIGAEPTAYCLGIGNMKARGSVILVEDLQPFSIWTPSPRRMGPKK